jgi:hypothetical protein
MKKVRSGSLMLESAMALTLIALALAGVSQLLLLAGKQQRAVEARRLAHREAGNVMERVMVLPATTLAQAAPAIDISAEMRNAMPSAKLSIDASPADEAGTTEIRVEISWRDANGQAEQVELIAWTSAGSTP